KTMRAANAPVPRTRISAPSLMSRKASRVGLRIALSRNGGEGRVDMAESVLTERRGAVAIVTLNRPTLLNAWDRPMRQALMRALADAEADKAIGAIVLTGAGDAAFSAGQDLNE